MNNEQLRLEESRLLKAPWKKWGPYLSERQWGTVREDYSSDGDSWNYFTHDQARSRAYRWGEDGLAGVSDEKQRLCLALALWNGSDPILKERLFGLTNEEGNHGEDVKEYYYYLDSTPTHSYLKYLYKYPHEAYPYDELVATNRHRSKHQPEYELVDTGVFDDNRYFDVVVEYAKAGAEELLMRISIHNRSEQRAELDLLPTLWFRNTWRYGRQAQRPLLRQLEPGTVAASHPELGDYLLQCLEAPPLLFTENETNQERLYDQPNPTPFVKDAFDRYLVHGETEAVNPDQCGTKAAAHYHLQVPAKSCRTLHLRLLRAEAASPIPAAEALDKVFTTCLAEADEFYRGVIPQHLSDDERSVMRQALAGMLWSKQYYYFDLDLWLEEHKAHPLLGKSGFGVRNRQWFHMLNDHVISMPDKWEYPWYAAWDLAFHTIALQLVDPDFARDQLALMLSDTYQHPNGQLPAYEWNFGDVNPPVHAWATLVSFAAGRPEDHDADFAFLQGAFQKLSVNFTWWVNRKDPSGSNVFEGGFLGLDNIGVFDRSSKLPTGGNLEQADGTAWMALFAQNMFEIALELAQHDPVYEEMALKYLEHFLWIAGSMDRIGNLADELWDEEDGFYYDVLRLPDGSAQRIKVRSMVGLLPLCATTVLDPAKMAKVPRVTERLRFFLTRHPELTANLPDPLAPNGTGRTLLAVVNEQKLRRILEHMLDETRFLGSHGIRSLSRWHLEHPYTLQVAGHDYTVRYLPAESDTGMFGGNSNWRGPIWMPVNLLILRALEQMHQYYGPSFQVECPTGSGRRLNLHEVANELSRRLTSIFLLDGEGHRPVFGGSAQFQEDLHWRDLVLFYEYFHGDNGAGLGASHQTGWTGVVARLLGSTGSV